MSPHDLKIQTAIVSCLENNNSHPLWGLLSGPISTSAAKTVFLKEQPWYFTLLTFFGTSQLLQIWSNFLSKAPNTLPSPSLPSGYLGLYSHGKCFQPRNLFSVFSYLWVFNVPGGPSHSSPLSLVYPSCPLGFSASLKH